MFTGIVTDIGTIRQRDPLEAGVRLRIGTAYAPKSKYKVYWSLILAKPYEPPPSMSQPLPADGSTVVNFGGAVSTR